MQWRAAEFCGFLWEPTFQQQRLWVLLILERRFFFPPLVFLGTPSHSMRAVEMLLNQCEGSRPANNPFD